jgi:hypothetical protein
MFKNIWVDLEEYAYKKERENVSKRVKKTKCKLMLGA